MWIFAKCESTVIIITFGYSLLVNKRQKHKFIFNRHSDYSFKFVCLENAVSFVFELK